MKPFSKWFMVVVLVSLGLPCLACITPPPNPPVSPPPPPPPPPPPRHYIHRVAFPVGLHVPVRRTTCACGAGLGMPGSGLPSSLTVAGAFVAVYNPETGDLNPIDAFAFEANDLTAQVLAHGPALFEAEIWFGFSADVDPFSPPDLGDGEIYALMVDFDVLEEDLGSLIGQPVQLWGGEAFPNGVPDFQRGRYFTTKPPQIPAPR